MEAQRAVVLLGAALIGRQAGGVGQDVGDVALLLHPVEQVRHGALGEDGHVLDAVRL